VFSASRLAVRPRCRVYVDWSGRSAGPWGVPPCRRPVPLGQDETLGGFRGAVKSSRPPGDPWRASGAAPASCPDGDNAGGGRFPPRPRLKPDAENKSGERRGVLLRTGQLPAGGPSARAGRRVQDRGGSGPARPETPGHDPRRSRPGRPGRPTRSPKVTLITVVSGQGRLVKLGRRAPRLVHRHHSGPEFRYPGRARGASDSGPRSDRDTPIRRRHSYIRGQPGSARSPGRRPHSPERLPLPHSASRRRRCRPHARPPTPPPFPRRQPATCRRPHAPAGDVPPSPWPEPAPPQALELRQSPGPPTATPTDRSASRPAPQPPSLRATPPRPRPRPRPPSASRAAAPGTARAAGRPRPAPRPPTRP
jgi:hypothetical protein